MSFSKALLVAAFVACALAPGVAGRQKEAALQGYWEGAVTRDGKVWRVNFEIKRDGEKFGAVADFADAGGVDRAFSVEYDAPRVRMERPQPNGAPIVFEGGVAGDTLSGRFSGLGTTADFTLRRRGRERPRFYREEAVTFKNGEVTLSGTLLLPVGGPRGSRRSSSRTAGRPSRDWSARTGRCASSGAASPRSFTTNAAWESPRATGGLRTSTTWRTTCSPASDC